MAGKDSDDCKLSNTVKESKYKKLEKDRNQTAIIEFIRERFTERYITPLQSIEPKAKNGFCTLAICCLLIEALESFWRGWPKSESSELAFCSFFSRSVNLSELQGYSQEFYKHIRCGILHQGETTGGWRVTRKGRALFDPPSRTINATRFHARLKICLDTYCDALSKASWDDQIWRNLRKKMKAICKNCHRPG